MKRYCLLLLLFGVSNLHAQTAPWSGVLAPSRAILWNPGVVGGIPSASWSQCVTSACQTVTNNGPSSTTAQINAAIASAPANTYVLLPAGTYTNATSGICFAGHSNVVLRGAGANKTILQPTSGASCHGFGGGSFGIGMSSADGNSSSSVINGPVAVSGQLGQGSTSIVLASVPNLLVGNPIILDQLDTTVDNGGILVTQANTAQSSVAPGSSGPYTLDGDAGHSQRCSSDSSPANCRSQEQMVEVTSCNGDTTVGDACSGSNVTVGISPSLNMPNWNSANSPQAWWSSSPALNDGVEDLTVDATNDSGALGIELFNCQGCWVKGTAVLTTSQSHIQLFYALHASIVNNYLFLTQNAAPASYGVECYSGFNSLIENNIMQGVTTPMISNGSCSGTVWGYNFAINEYYISSPGYNIPARGDHASGDDSNLSEGNITNGHTADVIHGTANRDTDFRNYFTGLQPVCYSGGSSYSSASYGACNNNVIPEQVFAFHRFYNLIGNVLGTTGVNKTYSSSSFVSGSSTVVLGIGYGDGGVPSDPNVASTIMLWGNADSATGFASPRFNCSEVPTSLTGAQASFSNPCPSSQTLPSSFYYTSTPSWWPSGKPFPPIGPDVNGGNLLSCTSGTYNNSLVTSASQCSGGSSTTAAGGRANSIPAMDCYYSLGGLPDGTGPALSNFNESSCYSGQSVSTSKPAPPTDLNATVN